MPQSIAHPPFPLTRSRRWLATGTLALGLLASTSCAETTRLMLPVSPDLAAQLQRLDQERQRILALEGTIQRDMGRVECELTKAKEHPTPIQTPTYMGYVRDTCLCLMRHKHPSRTNPDLARQV